MYYPSISSLKAEAIPEETRAGVMTLLRIPMNLGVGIIMWHVSLYWLYERTFILKLFDRWKIYLLQ
jgi:hypothetical protein